MLGMQRMDALERIVIGGLYLILFFSIIAPILVVTGLVLNIIDVAWQLLTNREGIRPMNLFRSAWMSQLGNATWALTGEGEFDLTIFG